ncbi:1-phosphofructokinase [Candidatus Galacturonibacter soehngenii]|uniref:Tagatose-6-phosphate kinase n=1 Tax=Candidatus Galacturonatibacter soehngenii TaxID=2307010 RepID=A0A7V7UI17_9FIRM|nr:1-phosphofructokinase [Candidatus Galacturonibacter soehngenii]KAB1440678.1 1-phosphofructokinase [Candidatus Galacturonibacter soehngenii]
MIYTVTFSPCLDYAVWVDELKLGEVNRVDKEHMLPGGKGINVSIVLHNLGYDSMALGFVSGFTGREIEAQVKEMGLSCNFIHLNQGNSRINIKLKAEEETDINGIGPVIEEKHLQKLFEQLERLKENDILVLAGSIPNGVSSTIYCEIMERLKENKVKIVVDATNDLLVNVLEKKPFLIKPNNHELGEIFGIEISKKEDIVYYAKKLQEMGARNVLVSMAGDGAVFISEEGNCLESKAPKGKVVNSVGAGDSMVAGFLAGYLERRDYEYAFKMGVATGSASAFSNQLAKKEEVLQLLKTIL